ncbi:hypothetical protein Q9F39_004222 [Vibrio fluvialis]|nr:hypothetical protein [Vibrio fluvialis]
MSLTDGQQEVKRLEEATSTFVEVMRSEQNTANVPNVGSVKTVKQRVREAVGGQFDYVEQVVSRAESVELSVAQKENSAALSAQKAKQSEENAAAVVTGGTATTTPQPGKIPLADANGKIDDAWLGALSRVRSGSDMMADRSRNNQLFAASGHIHAGKHRNDVNPVYGRPIQDGLWTYLNNSNVLRMGSYKELSNIEGKSETYESVFNVSGVTFHLKGMNSLYGNAQLTLPPAPKGTEVYNSESGVLTNFETDIDPKYGNVAADTTEAVARAFEGMAKNGDFRLGSDFWTTASGRGTMSIQDGKCTLTDTTNSPIGGSANWSIPDDLGLTSGVTYIVELFVDSLVNEGDAWIRLGHYQDPEQRNEILKVGRNRFEFTAGLTGSSQGMLIYSGKLGTLVFSSFSYRQKTAEVVTNPVDLIGLEVFLRPITASDPFVYPYGMQQSKLTSADGIPTVENNVRPITHFEVYPGDQSSRGRGWSLLDGSLTDAQKAKIFQNPEHNIYRMGDGTLAQWTVSQRTIRGAGNGDWEAIFASGSGDLSLCYKNKTSSLVTARGALDAALSASYSNSYRRPARVSLNSNDLGIWKLIETNAASVAKNNECFFYVIGTVPRLNQGAYHPTFNPMGTASGWKNDGSGRAPWSDSHVTQFISEASCFKASSDSSGSEGGYDPTTGKLGGRTDRTDGLLHDVIYASGINGVIDHRPKYGAWDASSVGQAAAVREEVMNATYRGRDQLVFSHVQAGTQSSAAASTNAFTVDDVSKFGVGDLVSIVSDGVTIAKERVVTSIGSSNITFNGEGISRDVKSYYFVVTTKTNLTIEGEFTQIDVIGDPANILMCAALKHGWLGGWVMDIPDGVTNEFTLVRKWVGSSVAEQWSDNHGESWSSSSSGAGYDLVKNAKTTFALPVGRIQIVTYKAYAKQTVPSENLTVLDGDSGMSSVFHTSHSSIYLGCLLAESVLNIIYKGSSKYLLGKAALKNLGAFDLSGKFYTAPSLLPTHSSLNQNGTGTENDSHAGKFLFHKITESGQVNLNIVANEIIYNSTAGNWGDDSKLKILADSSFTDLNGNKCKAVIHKLAKPYGFIKNKS